MLRQILAICLIALVSLIGGQAKNFPKYVISQVSSPYGYYNNKGHKDFLKDYGADKYIVIESEQKPTYRQKIPVIDRRLTHVDFTKEDIDEEGQKRVQEFDKIHANFLQKFKRLKAKHHNEFDEEKKDDKKQEHVYYPEYEMNHKEEPHYSITEEEPHYSIANLEPHYSIGNLEPHYSMPKEEPHYSTIPGYSMSNSGVQHDPDSFKKLYGYTESEYQQSLEKYKKYNFHDVPKFEYNLEGFQEVQQEDKKQPEIKVQEPQHQQPKKKKKTKKCKKKKSKKQSNKLESKEEPIKPSFEDQSTKYFEEYYKDKDSNGFDFTKPYLEEQSNKYLESFISNEGKQKKSKSHHHHEFEIPIIEEIHHKKHKKPKMHHHHQHKMPHFDGDIKYFSFVEDDHKKSKKPKHKHHEYEIPTFFEDTPTKHIYSVEKSRSMWKPIEKDFHHHKHKPMHKTAYEFDFGNHGGYITSGSQDGMMLGSHKEYTFPKHHFKLEMSKPHSSGKKSHKKRPYWS